MANTPTVPPGRTIGRAAPPSTVPNASVPLATIPGVRTLVEGGEDTGGTATEIVYVYAFSGPPGATDICNGAIDLVGAGLDDWDHLDDFDTDVSRLADHCRRRYHRARCRALTKWTWPEAAGYLAATAADSMAVKPTNHYEYSYAIPALGEGLLAVRRIVDAYGSNLVYELHGRYILTDFLPSEFWWEVTLNLASGFSEPLARCIEYELAIDLCGTLLKGEAGTARRRQLHQEYRELALPDAVRAGQSETYDRTNAHAPTPWIDIF